MNAKSTNKPSLSPSSLLHVKHAEYIRFQVLGNICEGIKKDPFKGIWESIKNGYIYVSNTVLGVKNKQDKNWINASILNLIDNRRNLKEKMMEAKSNRV